MADLVVCKWDPTVVPELVALGARVHLVLDDFDLGRPLDDAVVARCVSLYRVATFDSIDEISAVAVDLLLRGAKVERILSFTEFSQYGAGLLANLLGVDPAGPGVAAATRDKRLMKTRVAEHGVRVARFCSIGEHGRGPTVENIVATTGLPCVVKPVNGMGSVDTVIAHDRAELEQALAAVEKRHPLLASGQTVIEQYLSGEELHVDAVWRDGQPWLFVVSRYFVPRAAVPTPGRDNGSYVIVEADEPGLYDVLRAMHGGVNRALDIHTGVTHAEFLTGADGAVYFSEIATRMAGADIPVSVGAQAGYDVKRLYAASVAGTARPRPGEPARHHTIAWINLAPEVSGVLGDVEALAERLRARDDVYNVTLIHQQGELVELAHPSVWVVLVTIGAGSPTALRDLARELERDFPVPVQAADARAEDAGR